MNRVKVVNVGIDTIKINVRYIDETGQPLKNQEFPEHLERLFQLWQEQAKAQSKPMPTTMVFHNMRMNMLPVGAPVWKYILKNDCLQLAVVPRLCVPVLAKVTLTSAYLWSMASPYEAVNEVKALLVDVFGMGIMLQAAQIDLCVDLAGFHVSERWQQMFLSRARRKRQIEESQKDQSFYRGRNIETLLFSGHGRPISCRVYDKIAEIEQCSGKTWFYDLWEQQGWKKEMLEQRKRKKEKGKESVWRIEYSVEREGLHEMGLEDIYDTLRNVKRLWAYCTQEWLRMVLPEAQKNRTRWATAPVWKVVQRAFDKYDKQDGKGLGPLVRQRVRERNIERGVAAVAGYATTLAAWCDDILDEQDDAAAIFSVIYNMVLERWGKLDVVPQDIVREKRFLYGLKG